MRRYALLLAFFLAGLGASSALAQSWPDRPIRLVVPFTTGGAQDVIARLVGQKLSESVGQPVVIENKAGAGGVIAAQEVARAAPDGYTLLLSTGAQISIAPALQRDVGYAPKDFVHVAHVADAPLVLIANPSLPFRTVKDVVDYAKAHPGELNCASTGNGSYTHLTLELFKTLTGADITHVPYKGAAPAITDLMAKQVQLMFTSTASAQPYTSNGRLRAIAVTAPKRAPAMADTPTFAESGVKDLEISVWIGISGPAGLPAPVAARINAEVNKALQDPAVRSRLATLGTEPAGGTSTAFDAMVKADAARWATVVREKGIKAE